jgi:hypothetical protein
LIGVKSSEAPHWACDTSVRAGGHAGGLRGAVSPHAAPHTAPYAETTRHKAGAEQRFTR